MSPIPLGVLAVVFVGWLLGVTVVLAVLRNDLGDKQGKDGLRREDGREREPYR